MLRKNRKIETVSFVFPLFLRPLYFLPFLTTKEISMLSYNTNSNFFKTYMININKYKITQSHKRPNILIQNSDIFDSYSSSVTKIENWSKNSTVFYF